MARKRGVFSTRVQSQPLLKITKQYRRLLVLILGALFGLLSALSLPAWSNVDRQSLPLSQAGALELAQSGQQRYQAGEFNEAAQLWQQAAQVYEQAGDREGMSKSLINKSQALQDLGLYAKSCDTLLQVFAVDTLNCNSDQLDQLLTTLSERSEFSLTEAIGLRSLGNVLRRQGFLQPSQSVLQLSLAKVAETPEQSATLLSLANTERAIGNQVRNRWDYEEITEIIDSQSLPAALAPYEKALNLYQQAATVSSSAIAEVQAQLNELSLLLESNQWWVEQINRRLNSWSRLKQDKVSERAAAFSTHLQGKLTETAQTLQRQIEPNLASLPASRAAVDARLNFAQNLMQLQERERAQSVLETAREQAHALKDWRAESYALGYLGKLDSQREQSGQAIELTQQALMLAQEQTLSGDAREVTYLWQSQLGRLLREERDIQGALSAYTAAFNTLQSLRADLNSNNRDVQFNFREQVKPVYLDLADLLLQTDFTEDELDSLVVLNPLSASTDLKRPQNRLNMAQRVIESLQVAELDNFFQDPCVEETNVAVEIEDIDPQAAVFYPIILPDRLEVLLSLPGKELQTIAIPVNEQTVNQALDQLYDTLDNPTIDDSARNILSTSNPAPGELEENLQRLLPTLTQMYDWIIRPWETQLAASSVNKLVFVLNGRLQKVPLAALYDGSDYLLEKYAIALAPGLQLIGPEQIARQPFKVLAAGVSEQVQVRGETFPALAYVPEELNQIAEAFPSSQKLLNEEFTQTTLQNQLQSDFSVVHLATHAQFSSDPEKNFIVTGQDNSISIDQLSTLLKGGNAQVPQLLVLSACQTATGDEQAVLGLAGVSVRSGVSSTLATLWPVEDASTTQLMGQFYQQLREPGGKKLEALRSAQLSLMQSLGTEAQVPSHPYYWAPYVLVGNWQ